MSEGSEPAVEGVSYVDPRATFILDRHTGRTPELKTKSYYKRSWTSGKPSLTTPVCELPHLATTNQGATKLWASTNTGSLGSIVLK
eukprot:scaffold156238_cov30-Tisochrysis_lutea.AAC.1